MLRGELEKPLREVLWGEATHLLQQTEYTQPALFALEYALSQVWKSWGITPGVVLGHSVGEYVAACVAGVYSLADGLKLIAARGRLMQRVSGRGAMAAVMAGEEQVREALEGLAGQVSLAAVNAPQSVVISGYEDGVAIAEERLKKAGVRVERLRVSHGFHSPQMAEMEQAFEAIAGGIDYAAPRVKLLSSVTGKELRREDIHGGYWRRQVREPVRFQAAMEELQRSGQHVYIEVGPGTTLLGLGRQCTDGEDTTGNPERMWAVSVRNGRGEWQQMLESLGRLYERGAEVDWDGFDNGYARQRVALPSYPFQRQRYWIDLQPARRVLPTAASLGQHLVGADAGEAGVREQSALFEVQWHPMPHPVGANDHHRMTGDWLIVADQDGTGACLAEKLTAAGARCTILDHQSAWDNVLESRSWYAVVYLRALDAPATQELTYDMLPFCLSPSCRTLLDLVQHLSAKQGDRPPHLWLVTRGAEFVYLGQQSMAILQAPLLGMSQAIREEYPEWHCVCVDLDPTDPPGAVDFLSEEIRSGGAEDQVAFRRGERFVSRLVPQTVRRELVSPRGNHEANVSADGTYLIAGGLGALGLHVARRLVKRGARNLVLVGRSEPSRPARDFFTWAKANGAYVRADRADISSKEDIKRVLSEIARTMPPLRGIVHTAAILDDGVLTQQTWDRFERVLAPKISGAWALHELTLDSPLDFFVLFSSVASVLGAPGQANYAAANAFEDALAHYRRLRGKPAVSINWGAWSEGLASRGGMERRREMGITSMSPEEGTRAARYHLA